MVLQALMHKVSLGIEGYNHAPAASLGLIHTGCATPRDAQRNASKWNLQAWMEVFTLHASNIKGFAFEFAFRTNIALLVAKMAHFHP